MSARCPDPDQVRSTEVLDPAVLRECADCDLVETRPQEVAVDLAVPVHARVAPLEVPERDATDEPQPWGATAEHAVIADHTLHQDANACRHEKLRAD